jgi:hypothetical protein
MTLTSCSMRCGIKFGLLAVGRDARCSGGLGVGGGKQRLGLGFVEDGLDDPLLLGAEDLGQAVVELGLFLLQACGGWLEKIHLKGRHGDLLRKTCLNMP